MIPFNIFGHSNTAGDNNEEPIVWVDSSDSSSYTLSGNDVTALMNKGTLGGAMTLNGAVKFANSGFESWSNSDYISFLLGTGFMRDNSFTIAVTYDLQDISSGSVSSRNSFAEIRVNNLNAVAVIRGANDMFVYDYRASLGNGAETSETYQLGVQTSLYTFDLQTLESIRMLPSGAYEIKLAGVFQALNDLLTLLLSNYLSSNSGADNPLHEFRLYDRAFSLTEMQTLQTELNNKYTT